MSQSSQVSVIILSLNAEQYINKLIQKLMVQTIIPKEIIVFDSDSNDKTVEICKNYNIVKVFSVKRDIFDHAKVRNEAVIKAQSDIVLMLSQDVMPIENDYIEKLITPLLQFDDVVACSGRQIAYSNATIREKLTREYNYKETSCIKSKSDINSLGIKTFFLSDSCSAYKKSALFDIGMYEEPGLMCCDMIIAAKFLDAGYRIAYVADATVYHSHNYTLKKQYSRNFDIGADLEIHKSYFKCEMEELEGIRMVKYVLGQLIRNGHFIECVHYCAESFAKYLGHRAGKRFYKYSFEQILKRTTYKSFWIKYFQKF